MSLIGDYNGIDNCRFTIDSLEFHKRGQLRVRIKVFSPSDYILDRYEEKITFDKILPTIDMAIAESKLNKTSITKEVNKVAKEKGYTKQEKDQFKNRLIQLGIAEQMKIIAKEKIDNVFECFIYKDNAFKTAYAALKNLPKYQNMIDQD